MLAGERQRESVLQAVAANLEAWTLQVKREKATYHTLNKLSVDVTRKVLVAEAWCPVSGISRVQQALQLASQQNSGSVRYLHVITLRCLFWSTAGVRAFALVLSTTRASRHS